MNMAVCTNNTMCQWMKMLLVSNLTGENGKRRNILEDLLPSVEPSLHRPQPLFHLIFPFFFLHLSCLLLDSENRPFSPACCRFECVSSSHRGRGCGRRWIWDTRFVFSSGKITLCHRLLNVLRSDCISPLHEQQGWASDMRNQAFHQSFSTTQSSSSSRRGFALISTLLQLMRGIQIYSV